MISILQIEPLKFIGLKQAAYISKCLVNGKSKKEMAIQLEGDRQLVEMWVLFLKHNRWIEESRDGSWSHTEKGRAWISRME